MLRHGCGSIGRAVASETKGPRFESSHRQIYWKDENKKEAENGPFKNEKESLAYEVVKRPRVRIPPPGR